MMAVALLAAVWWLGALERGVLLAVQINPEARVKAQRGPAPPRLVSATAFLVRVDNEAGTTALVRLLSPHAAVAGQAAERDRWLRAELTTLEGGAPRLTGRRREYLLLRLETDQRGRREATLAVDIGQGTQDLGFRAEVTLLFRCEGSPAP